MKQVLVCPLLPKPWDSIFLYTRYHSVIINTCCSHVATIFFKLPPPLHQWLIKMLDDNHPWCYNLYEPLVHISTALYILLLSCNRPNTSLVDELLIELIYSGAVTGWGNKVIASWFLLHMCPPTDHHLSGALADKLMLIMLAFIYPSPSLHSLILPLTHSTHPFHSFAG